jgi:outer membrane biosynthesis protein TonB
MTPVVLKTLNNYIDQEPVEQGLPGALRLGFKKNRRFNVLLSISVVVHILFYAALIKLDSWAMMQAIASGNRPVPLVKLFEVAPPPDRSTLRSAPEPIERADINRLQFDPNTADDVHLVPRSPKPAERRGTDRLPAADVIERELRSSRGSVGRNRAGATDHQSAPPQATSIQANRIPLLDEAVTAQSPPTQTAPIPPAPQPRQDSSGTTPGSSEASPAGTRRGSSSESSALGLEAAQGQYMALVRAKIRKVNERIMPREWIKDMLRDKVSADFKLVIRRDGHISSVELWRPTGYPVLDDAARQAIFTASPFEGFPQSAGNTITMTVTVYFYPLYVAQ